MAIKNKPGGKPMHRSAGGAPLGFRLRKGDEKPAQGNRPGADLDYFRVDFAKDQPTVPVDAALEAWHGLYGDKPQVIRGVQFYAGTQDAVWSEANEQWGSAGGSAIVMRRCDGDEMSQCRIGDKTVFGPRPCLCANETKPLCKQTGRFTFWLPELCRAVGSIFTGMLVTHGVVDIDNISGTVIKAFETFPDPRRLTLVLHRRQVQVTTPDGMPVKKWMVFLDLDVASAQYAAQLALDSGIGSPLALPSSVVTPLQVELTSFWVRLDGAAAEYRFKGADGKAYATTDHQLVVAVIPNIIGYEPGKQNIHNVPYPVWAEVINGNIVGLVRGS